MTINKTSLNFVIRQHLNLLWVTNHRLRGLKEQTLIGKLIIRCLIASLNFCEISNNLAQKQPSRGVFRKRFSEKIQQIYRRTPMLKCDFNKVEITLHHRCSPVNLLYIFRTPFPKNTCGGLLLLKTTLLLKSKEILKLLRKLFS